MWIFSKNGFFSVTQNAQRRDLIQIRARAKKDLQSLKDAYAHLDRSPIIETAQADYRWRLVVQRWKWELVAGKLMADIDYCNFKGKIATIPDQRDKCRMLHDIWDLHHEYQQRRHAPDPHAGHPELFRPHGDRLFSDDWHEPEDDRPDHAMDAASLAVRGDEMEEAWAELEQGEQDREDDRKGRQKAEPTPGRRKASKTTTKAPIHTIGDQHETFEDTLPCNQ
jgi:hypothetical protein